MFDEVLSLMLTQLSLFEQLEYKPTYPIAPAPAQKVRAATTQHTVAEYFAGIGLVRLGLQQASWQVVYANDFDASNYQMYSSYFANGGDHYKVEDIFDLNPAQIPPTTLATSSFPCIDLSLAGKQNGLRGAHSSAFWGFIRILQAQKKNRSPVVLLENVPGWITSNKGQDFRTTIQALNQLGYCCDVYALDALHFTPQSRLRIFVVGMRHQKANPDLFHLERRSSSLLTNRLKKAIWTHRDLDWNVTFCPPSPPAKKKEGLGLLIETMTDHDARWWDQKEVERHLAMMAPTHLSRVNSLINQAVINYRTVYRRTRGGEQRAEVRKNDTAGCLRTAKGGSSRQIMIAAGKGQIKMRHMTPREYARLQGVPDEYPIPPNTIQALNGFGDAVCVPVIRWIAEHVLKPLMGTLE